MYELARAALTMLSGDPHSVPQEIMAALEEIRTVGERSLQAVRAYHRLDGTVPSSTVFVPRDSQPQQPQPHPPHPQPHPQHQPRDSTDPQTHEYAAPALSPHSQPESQTPLHPIPFSLEDTGDFYRPFTPRGSVFRVSPIRDFSIPQYTNTDAPSSSSFPPPHDPISVDSASQVEALTQAEDMPVDSEP